MVIGQMKISMQSTLQATFAFLQEFVFLSAKGKGISTLYKTKLLSKKESGLNTGSVLEEQPGCLTVCVQVHNRGDDMGKEEPGRRTGDAKTGVRAASWAQRPSVPDQNNTPSPPNK